MADPDLSRWRGGVLRVRDTATTLARRPGSRRVARVGGVLGVALLGGVIGGAVAPATTAYVGPLQVDVRVHPSLTPGLRAEIPPVGQISFDTFTAPLAVTGTVRSVDVEVAERLVDSPQGVLALQVTAPDAIRSAAIRAALTSTGCIVGGAALGGFLVYRGWRRPTQTGAAALAGVLVVGVATAATFDQDGFAAPSFTGPLSQAPYVATQTGGLVDRLESYRSGLSDLVQSVTTLYAVSERLPTLPESADGEIVTALHISDIHLNPLGFDVAQRLVDQFDVDLVIDTGDLVTWGTDAESSVTNRIGQLGVPYLFVAGNHDSPVTADAVRAQPNATVLDDDVATLDGLTFAGISDPRYDNDSGESAGTEANRDRVEASVERLAATVAEWNDVATSPVDVALVHDPNRLGPLLGEVPLVLTGHTHTRAVTFDESGTLVMTEGSTGGAGVTAGGFAQLADGEPLELTATLLYFDTGGDRAGRVVAYDEVTVGGLGLASVSLQRHVVRPEDVEPRQGEGPPERTPGVVPSDDVATPAEPDGAVGTPP